MILDIVPSGVQGLAPDEINAMIDESERQIANGEYYSNEQVMDMLAGELGLSDEEYLAASKQRRSEFELEKAV